MDIRSLGGSGIGGFDGMLGYGAAISFSFMSASPLPSFIWTGTAAVGRLTGSWPPGWGSIDSFGAASALIDRLYAQLGIGAPSKAPEKKKVPEGTDSPEYATRGRSYIRERIGNGNPLPTQSDVLNNIFGDKANDATWNDEKKKDRALRTVTEKIVNDWINDPKARTEFMRKWNMAKDDIGRAEALLDPRGDGGYLQHLSEFVTGLQSGGYDIQVENIRKVAEWFTTNFGNATLAAMGEETAAIARSLGIGSSTPLTNKEKYIGKLVDRGYSREESEMIVSTFNSEEMADEAMRRMDKVADRAKLDEARRAMRDAQRDLAELGTDPKNEANRKQLQRNIQQYDENIKAGEGERAKGFIQNYMKIVESRFGHTPQELGYEAGKLPTGVKDVPTAVVWIQNQLRQRGHNVYVPALPVEEPVPTATPVTSQPTPKKKKTPPKPKAPEPPKDPKPPTSSG